MACGEQRECDACQGVMYEDVVEVEGKDVGSGVDVSECGRP